MQSLASGRPGVKLLRAVICCILTSGTILTMLLADPVSASSSTAPVMSVDQAVKTALVESPAIHAVQSSARAATASLQQFRSGYNPQLEIAPGVGFTNGNALLSLRLDSAERSALSHAASGELTSAEARLNLARLRVASETRLAYFDLVRARETLAATEESVKVTESFAEALKKRVEIGETAPFEALRAEIEAESARQEQLSAQNDVRIRQASLNKLLGRPLNQEINLSSPLALPQPAPSADGLRRIAFASRPEIAEIRGQIDARKGDLALARAARRPSVFAEAASDTWSLNRDPFQSENLGVQLRVGMPLWDRGSIRADKERASARINEQTAELEATQETIGLEVEQSASELETRRRIAENYLNTIQPKSRMLLDSATKGFDAGLTSVIETLDAQRVARRTQLDTINALFSAVKARITLDATVGSIGIDTQAQEAR